MPTFKHPCPHCGKYIQRDAAKCEFCGTSDPFNPANAPALRSQAAQPAANPGPQSVQGAAKCTGCGAPLAAGARFCTVCGTLAT